MPTLAILIASALISAGKGLEVEVSAGAFWRKLPDVLCYEATIPLIYESQWSPVEEFPAEKFQVKYCRNRPDPQCNMLRKLELLDETYEREFADLARNLNLEKSRSLDDESLEHTFRKRSLNFIADGLNYCCGVATQHKLDEITDDENNIKISLNKLTEGLSDSLKQISQNFIGFEKFENSTIFNSRATEKHIKLIQNYINSLQNENQKQFADTSNFATANLEHQFLNLKRIIRLGRLIKRQNVLNSCRNHQIPIELIDVSILNSHLTKLNLELRESGQELATLGSGFSKLLHLPISDCTFTADKLFINIRVPITQRHNKWKIYELVTSPFAWKNQTCSIQHQITYLAISENSKTKRHQIRQITGMGLHQCKPHSNKLCFLPRFTVDHLQGQGCALKLYYGATVDEIAQNCPINCHTSTNTFISEINDNTFIITHPKQSLRIICGDQVQAINTHYQGTPGAIKTYLPCNCKMIEGKNELIPERFPCRDDADNIKITHIIPAAWSNLKSFVLNPDSSYNLPKFKNLSECINLNWTNEIPHFNWSTTKGDISEILNKIKVNENLGSVHAYSYHGDSIYFIWNCVISGCVVYLLFKRRELLTLLATATPVRAEATTEENLLLILIILGLVAFSVATLWIVISQILDKRKKTQRTEEPINNAPMGPRASNRLRKTRSEGQIKIETSLSNQQLEILNEALKSQSFKLIPSTSDSE